MPGWYRTAGAAGWRFLAIAGALGVVVYALVHLRVIVLPIIVAVLASTLLLPIVAWLKRPDTTSLRRPKRHALSWSTHASPTPVKA